MPLTDKQWTNLALNLQRALARVAPDWPDAGPHDPGITVLELLAFVLDELQSRSDALDPQARLLARRVAARASALATAPAQGQCVGALQRVNYVSGMLLGVDDFRVEQDYFRSRLNRHNRRLHGSGIVEGLAVTAEAGANNMNGPQVTLAPGFALDRHGNEICVDVPVVLSLPAQSAVLFVQISYAEQETGLAPLLGGSPLDTTAAQPTRIAETFSATLAADPAVDAVDAVLVARLRQVRGRWRVDTGFKAQRVGEQR